MFHHQKTMCYVCTYIGKFPKKKTKSLSEVKANQGELVTKDIAIYFLALNTEM